MITYIVFNTLVFSAIQYIEIVNANGADNDGDYNLVNSIAINVYVINDVDAKVNASDVASRIHDYDPIYIHADCFHIVSAIDHTPNLDLTSQYHHCRMVSYCALKCEL